MRNIVVIALLALVVAGLVPKFADRITGPRAAPSAASAARVDAVQEPVAPSGPRSVTIPRDFHGNFQVEGAVDGRHLDFIVDTGASFVSLSAQQAARLGYHPAQRDYALPIQTANGVARAAKIRLDMVEVGGVTVRNVDALVMPDESLSDNLLGLSFLSRLHRFEYREGRLVLEE